MKALNRDGKNGGEWSENTIALLTVPPQSYSIFWRGRTPLSRPLDTQYMHIYANTHIYIHIHI